MESLCRVRALGFERRDAELQGLLITWFRLRELAVQQLLGQGPEVVE